MVRFPRLFRWMIWGALSLALVVYLIVVQVSRPDQVATGNDSLRFVLYGVGLVSFLLGQGIGYLVNHLRTPDGGRRVPTWIDQGFIVALALTEAIGIYGLVLALTGLAFSHYVPLFVLSALGMLLLRPSAFYRVADSLEQ